MAVPCMGSIQCMKRPVAHSLSSTWFWIELPENCCEPLKFIMKYISIQFCERPGHGRPFHALSIQRLLCITFMTSQSHFWRYCCIISKYSCKYLLSIMMSCGPGLLRRWFGDHRKRPIYEFDWIVISIEIQLIKTANRMAEIITLFVCK